MLPYPSILKRSRRNFEPACPHHSLSRAAGEGERREWERESGEVVEADFLGRRFRHRRARLRRQLPQHVRQDAAVAVELPLLRRQQHYAYGEALLAGIALRDDGRLPRIGRGQARDLERFLAGETVRFRILAVVE